MVGIKQNKAPKNDWIRCYMKVHVHIVYVLTSYFNKCKL